MSFSISQDDQVIAGNVHIPSARRLLTATCGVFAGLIFMSAADRASAQESAPTLTAVDALDLCKNVIMNPKKARAMLQSKGWKAKVSTNQNNAIYNEPEAGFFEKDQNVLIFILKNTSMGREKEDYPGSCQAIFAGNSSIAATEVAVHLKEPADGFKANMGKVSQSFVFKPAGYTINLANLTDKTDPSKNTGAMRVIVAPE